MGVIGLVFAMFTVGYIVGVWTALMVLRTPRGRHEDAIPVRVPTAPVIVIGGASHAPARRR